MSDQHEPTSDRPKWGRDPARIPMVLKAIEREWLKNTDSRLGQLIVNVIRRNLDPPRGEEGVRLFSLEDGQLLHLLGPETDEEREYIASEPEKRREGWRERMEGWRERQSGEQEP